MYPAEYYRLTNEAELHRGVQYEDGLVVDPEPFNPTGECSAGGMYFFSRDELPGFVRYVASRDFHWIREVRLPRGAKVHLEDGKRKADKFVLRPRQRFDARAFLRNASPKDRMTALRSRAWAAAVLIGGENLTPDERAVVIRTAGGDAIGLLPNLSPEERMDAVRTRGYNIMFITEPTPAERMAAIENNAWAITEIRDPTPGERKAALKLSGGAVIDELKTPTPAEILFARRRGFGGPEFTREERALFRREQSIQ